MLVPRNIRWFLDRIAFILLISATSCKSQWLREHPQNAHLDPEFGTCSSDELNHSNLVACTQDGCNGDQTTGAISNHVQDLVHVVSSKDGDRLKVEPIEVLNIIENDFERSFNVNTTLTVLTKPKLPSHSVGGFGATLNMVNLLNCLKRGILEQNYRSIISDLFGSSGAKHSTLRLILSRETISDNGISDLIERLDKVLVDVGVSTNNVELLLDLESMEWSTEVTETLTAIEKKLDSVRAIKSLTLASNSKILSTHTPDPKRSNSSDTNLVLSVDTAHRVVSLHDAANFVDSLSTVERKDLSKIIVQAGNSTPYNILDHLRASGDFKVVTVAQPRPKTNMAGDWQNAKDYAVEIMNLLKHGSNHVVEPLSSVDPTGFSWSQDASLYSLHEYGGAYLRGPMFYAMSHFSRYLPPDTLPLETSLFTQPNMFAAQYAAYLTPSNDIVTIVLNDNDYLLPFRMSFDGVIKIYTGIKAKSFNTFVLKR